MNHKQFKYVLTLANEGSFSRAAEALDISQPSLSQYIKKIETQAGVELFDRTNGEVRLSDAGRVYIDVGRKILDLEHQMEVRFSDLAVHKTGTLIIGASPYRAACMLPAVAKRFQTVYPGICLIVQEDTTSGLAERTEHGECDLCLTMLPLDARLFKWEKVTEEELVLAVPAAFSQFPSAKCIAGKKYPAISVKQVNGQHFVTLTETQFMQKRLEYLIQDYGLSIKTAAVVKSLEAQIAMVQAGVGIALMPSGVERFCNSDEVVFYSFAEPLPKREVVVMWRKDRKLSGVAEELKKIICDIKW